MSVVCFGEAIIDLVCERRVSSIDEVDFFRPHYGGAVANIAVAARRSGAQVRLVGGAGDDSWGRWLMSHLEREGVDLSGFGLVDGLHTPVAFVTFDPQGEPRFLIYGEGIEACVRSTSDRLAETMADASGLVFGSNTLVGEPERALTLQARRLAAASGVPVLFDPNIREHRWSDLDAAVGLCRELCDGAFCVRANQDEARVIAGVEDPAGAAEELVALGARIAVVTRGARGAVMRGAARAEVEGVEVDVVSPLGAGDAFMGTLVAELAAGGWNPDRAGDALPAAARAGARACTHWGASA